MANFPNIKPTYGAIKKNAPAVRSIKFGSGYEQRATFGINQNPKVYELQFKVTENEANTIEAFLDEQEGKESFSFNYTIFSSTDTSNKFICRTWSRTMPTINGASITATFEEVFD